MGWAFFWGVRVRQKSNGKSLLYDVKCVLWRVCDDQIGLGSIVEQIKWLPKTGRQHNEKWLSAQSEFLVFSTSQSSCIIHTGLIVFSYN